MPARLEIAWTVSLSALDASAGYASAVLHLACAWEPTVAGPASCDAVLVRAGTRTAVPLGADLRMEVDRRGRWTHVDLRAGAGIVLRASFESGRLAYCTSTVPEAAGLRGGSYDPPTGILELYDRALPKAALAAGPC